MSVTAQPPSPRVKVRRLHERGAYDQNSIHTILDAGFIAHIGYVVDGQPYVTPTIYWREGDKVYWHGSSASRMLERLVEGIPCCFTVSMIDGLVLARSAFHHSVNYRSVMALGLARAVVDPAAKEATLNAFVERVAPGRWATMRPMLPKEIKATLVLEMDLTEASAKVRTGMPVDDEEDLTAPVWAGVIPFVTALGQPQPDPLVPAGLAPPAQLGRFG